MTFLHLDRRATFGARKECSIWTDQLISLSSILAHSALRLRFRALGDEMLLKVAVELDLLV